MKTIKEKHNIAKTVIILGLAVLAENRDKETGAHLDRIKAYTKIITEELGRRGYNNYITEKYIEEITLSSTLHDIGKIGIRDSVLLKPGKLTKKEFEEIKKHAIIGGEMLTAIESKISDKPFLTLGKEIAYHHHEKWDGTGYPDGLKGKQIPLSARIVALADVYDALTTERIYKKEYTHEKSREIIAGLKGTHFEPEVVDVFLKSEKDFQKIYIKLAAEARSFARAEETLDTRSQNHKAWSRTIENDLLTVPVGGFGGEV